MKNAKSKLTIAVFALILFSLAAAQLLLPDRALSKTERRKLTQKPAFSFAAISSREYSGALERYLLDQFPARNSFRSANALLRTKLLRQSDTNGLYTIGDALYKIEAALKEDQVLYAAKKMTTLYERYFADANVCWAMIPDKGYYAGDARPADDARPAGDARPADGGRPADDGRPGMDYRALQALLRENLPAEMGEISLTDTLNPACYYRTDTHWRQEFLFPVADRLLTGLQNPAPRLSADDYRVQTLAPFYGVYYGQAALPLAGEELHYLTNAVTEKTVVTSAELEGTLPVYQSEKFDGMDGYDVFLGGAQAILTLENPLASTERTLILFRDSFGSSLAPLLLSSYSKITLIDLRYVQSDILTQFTDLKADDVLFLYSGSLLNSGMLLK